MKNGTNLIALSLALLSAGCATTGAPLPQSAAMRSGSSPVIRVDDRMDLATRLLDVHNRERAAVGVPALRWDPELAVAAASYGPALSALGRLVHSDRAGRPGQSENLSMGTRGAYSPEYMVGTWASEKSMFRPGIFPDVSTTGNWLDVSHYTQMISRTTTAVGCAVHSDRNWDYLICRYSPKGNRDGERMP